MSFFSCMILSLSSSSVAFCRYEMPSFKMSLSKKKPNKFYASASFFECSTSWMLSSIKVGIQEATDLLIRLLAYSTFAKSSTASYTTSIVSF